MTLSNFLFYGILTICLLSISACKPTYQEVNNETEALPKVYVKELTPETTPIPIHATGLIQTASEVRLSFKIGGIIDQMYADEGQKVQKGQLLATLKLDEIQAEVAKATQGRDKALRDLERAQRLYEDTVVTLEQLQNIKTAYEVAKSDLDIAQFNKKFARISAPASGKILRRFTEPSELVSPGTPIFALGNTSSKQAYKLSAGLSDRDIVHIRMGDSALVTLDAYPDTAFYGRVTEIGQAADPRTGVFGIELTLTPNGYDLRNGFVGKAEIYPSTQKPYYKIPMNALIEGNQNEAKVFVPDDGIATLITITPQYIGDSYFTVYQKDWKGITQVITEGAAYLTHGVSFESLESPQTSEPSVTSINPN